jgi:hypothetical protein
MYQVALFKRKKNHLEIQSWILFVFQVIYAKNKIKNLTKIK